MSLNIVRDGNTVEIGLWGLHTPIIANPSDESSRHHHFFLWPSLDSVTHPDYNTPMEPNKTVTISMDKFKRIIGRLDLLGMDLSEMIPTIQSEEERKKMSRNMYDLAFIVGWMIRQTGQKIVTKDAGDLAMHGMTTAERMVAEIEQMEC